ncbi:histidine kinase [Dyadobacter sp. 676]|uniref:Histidine kinase n=1 Tax=Dyadobacter sp. 676 TaxID=3088362 RepID=A0AAU8FWN4_9BACT
MKKGLLLFVAVISCLSSVNAQVKWDEYSHSFLNNGTKPSVPALIVAVRKENNSFWETHERSQHFETLKKDKEFLRLRPKEMIARTVFDTACAQFFLKSVDHRNRAAYQFRVTEYPSKKVLVPWNPIQSFTDSMQMRESGLPQMAYLGGYRTSLGNMLIIDVRMVRREAIIATAMVAWEAIRPEIMSIHTSETLDKFFQQIRSPWLPDKQSASNFPLGFTMSSSNKNLVFALQDGVFNRKQIQYKLIRNGQLHTDWRDNDYDNSFIWLKDFSPGHYAIQIRYSAQPQHMIEYPFRVKPVWYQTIYFRVLACMLSVLLVSLLAMFGRQRRKIKQGRMDRSRLQLELKAIYAQLNPHFIFNALSSIQALMNKQDMRAANAYLSDFARLTRDSLVHSQKSEISLYEEIQTLDTYLKLEKLRFSFSYHIKIAPDVNTSETDIPALLLQPLVENAVKHGVASMGEKGLIQLSIARSGPAMIINLTDNGIGMVEGKPMTGFGLKLTNDRIRLLNQIYPDRLITMDISNVLPAGLRITLTFNHWFDESFIDR